MHVPVHAAPARRVRIAITRDEPADGPLGSALRARGLDAHVLPVTVEAPLADDAALVDAAAHLERYTWVVCASVRAVAALGAARGQRRWPAGLRSAAVGQATARALREMGADPPPVTAPGAGADALLDHLLAAPAAAVPWPAFNPTRDRVLVLTVSRGRRTLIDGLRAAGATVDDLEAYRMMARPVADIVAAWEAITPDGVVVTSPSAATGLVAALGAQAFRAPRVTIAIGRTTADALARLGVEASVASHPEFGDVAAHVAGRFGLGEGGKELCASGPDA